MQEREAHRCRRCGGQVTATHMLLATYPLDTGGRWQHDPATLREDVVLACSGCGREAAGHVQHDVTGYRFVPDSSA